MSESFVGGPGEPVRLLLHGREVVCKAIIFDKDGTLVDPTGFQSRLTRMMALRAAALATKDRLLAAACHPPHSAEDDPPAGPEDPSEAPEPAGQAAAGAADPVDEGEAEADDCPPGPGLLPGVGPMLATFRSLGLRMAVATGDRRQRAQAALDALGVGSHFAAIVSIDDVAHGKPAPDMVYAACERLGCSPSEVIVVGDSPADLMMGRAAGVAACIGVTGGLTASSRLGALADAVLPTVAELPGLFLPRHRPAQP